MTESIPDPPQGQILFVDDEENILRALKRLFMDENFTIFTATSGEEGLKILAENREIGVIVSDQRMPGMNGVDFLENSRKLAPHSLRILLTGYADVTAAIEAINRGDAFRYITKPWKDEELLPTIKEAWQRYFLIKENKRLSDIVIKQNKELKKWSEELELYVQEQVIELEKKYEELRELNERLRSNFKTTIQAFSGLLELRDKGMKSHSRNVATVAGRVATVLEMAEEDRETVMVAALLHDIGKIGIPDIMLLRDYYDDMRPNERSEYVKHPVRGQAALDAIEDLRKVGVIIRHHHERYDGKGFPDKIKGQDIPLAARIIAIVDFVDKNARKFQDDTGVDLAIVQIKADSGKQFDPQLVPFIEEQALTFYRARLPRADFVEIELNPRDLSEGMVLSREVCSGTGLLLLSKGTQLTFSNIQFLKRTYSLDPSKGGVFVWIKRG